MRGFSKVFNAVSKAANVAGPFITVAEGVSMVYDIATYKKRAQKEHYEREELIKKHTQIVYAQTAGEREQFIKDEITKQIKEIVPDEVKSVLNVVITERERRNGQNSNKSDKPTK